MHISFRKAPRQLIFDHAWLCAKRLTSINRYVRLRASGATLCARACLSYEEKLGELVQLFNSRACIYMGIRTWESEATFFLRFRLDLVGGRRIDCWKFYGIADKWLVFNVGGYSGWEKLAVIKYFLLLGYI